MCWWGLKGLRTLRDFQWLIFRFQELRNLEENLMDQKRYLDAERENIRRERLAFEKQQEEFRLIQTFQVFIEGNYKNIQLLQPTQPPEPEKRMGRLDLKKRKWKKGGNMISEPTG